jgi:hypothetical protein
MRRETGQARRGSTWIAGVGVASLVLLAAGAAQAGTPTEVSADEAATAENASESWTDPTSAAFSTAAVDDRSPVRTDSGGDLWANCWADDGNLYAANGDGRGFGEPPGFDIAVSRVVGTPDTGITGERLAAADDLGPIWGDPAQYNRKPTGMVCVDGDGDGQDELYLAIQDLRLPPCPPCFNDAPNASISRSDDYGETWEATSEPMFTDHRFTTIFFLDYGQSGEHVSVLGPDASRYVYAYGLDWNWRDSFSDTVPDPTRLYFGRVPKDAIQNRSEWEFFAGTDRRGRPTWTQSMSERVPVLQDERRVYPTLRGDDINNMTVLSQGSVVYNEPLDRYIYTSWTEYTFEFYEAPEPWGPWTLFMRKDFGGYPWFGESDDPACAGPKNGGYATVVPSKFISADGRRMWLQSDWWVGVGCGENNYQFTLRELSVEPRRHTVATNQPDPANNLAIMGKGVTPIEKSAHFGNNDFYNDGITNQSEDSWDRENKDLDFWGYTWDRNYNFDRVAYTTGQMFGDGGWFRSHDGGLRVQVRQHVPQLDEYRWVDVTGLSISPEYPFSAEAGPFKTFTFRFDDIRGEGIRIIGPPGGEAFFTSIAEMEVYFDERGPQRS